MSAQTITPFSPVGPQLLAIGSVTIVPPTASSGLPVTVTVLSGPATISGNVVTFTALGIVTLVANQAGNGTYSAAAQVTTAFVVMQTGFSPINLANVPAPDVVELLDYNTIFTAMLNDLQSRDATFTALVESDPAWKIIEVCAYREMLLRQRVNNAAQAVMLPYAMGADLDNLASFYGVTRNTITAANLSAIPPVAAVMETDASLRYRTTLALDGLSTAGPVNSYIFHALQDARVLAVSVVGPPTVSPGNVLVTLLGNPAADPVNVNSNGSLPSYSVTGTTVSGSPAVTAINTTNLTFGQFVTGTGIPTGATIAAIVTTGTSGSITLSANATASGTSVALTIKSAVLASVTSILNGTNVRPLTDSVTVQSATINSFSVAATIYTYSGPDPATVIANAQSALTAYLLGVQKVGYTVPIAGIISALFVPGVENVVLTSPTADVLNDYQHAGYCTGITLTNGGTAS